MTTQRGNTAPPAGGGGSPTNPPNKQPRAKKSQGPREDAGQVVAVVRAHAPVELPGGLVPLPGSRGSRRGALHPLPPAGRQRATSPRSSSRGDAIQGTFKQAVTYPPEGEARPAPAPVHHRAAGLRRPRLGASCCSIRGSSSTPAPLEEPRSWWLTLLISFGPTLLLIGGFIWLSRRRGQAAGGLGRRLRPGQEPRQALRPDRGGRKRVTFDDVAGIEEAEDELVEIVDFLKEPAEVHAPRRHGAEGRAAGRPARDRQDAAGPGGGRRGRRAVLQHGRLRVRRDDRRRRRQPRARPVQAGPRGRPGDHLHRRARRHRPGARQRRLSGGDSRAGADAEPDPDRDGRLQLARGRHRPGRHQPPGRARPGAAAARPLRPARDRPAPGQERARGDPEGPHPERAAGAGRRPGADRGRRRPGLVGADLRNLVNEAALLAARREARTPSTSATSWTRWRRSSSAPRASS